MSVENTESSATFIPFNSLQLSYQQRLMQNRHFDFKNIKINSTWCNSYIQGEVYEGFSVKSRFNFTLFIDNWSWIVGQVFYLLLYFAF